MMIILLLILAVLAMNTLATYLIHQMLMGFMDLYGKKQSEEYKTEVQKVNKKPMLPFKKERMRGRKIEKSDDLVDIADLPWEDGYRAMEDLDGKPSR